MYEISCEKSFAAAHSLRNYNGICENTHGHNWLVRVHVSAEELDETGFVMDFEHLEELLDFLPRQFDHKNLNEVPPFDQLNPTSENLARYVHDHVAKGLADTSVKVSLVEVYEQPNCRATYVP